MYLLDEQNNSFVMRTLGDESSDFTPVSLGVLVVKYKAMEFVFTHKALAMLNNLGVTVRGDVWEELIIRGQSIRAGDGAVISGVSQISH